MSTHKARLTKLTVILATATTIYAATATSASAGWFIEGSELTGTAALATKETVTEAFKLTAVSVTVECTASTVNATGSELQAPNLILATSLIFNECKAGPAESGCSLATKTIGTLPLLAEILGGLAPEDLAALKPKPSKTLAVIGFTGATCALLGNQPITGSKLPFPISLPTGQDTKSPQVLSTEIGEEQLKLGSSGANLKSATSLELVSGKAFQFKPKPSELFEWRDSRIKKKVTFQIFKPAGTNAGSVELIVWAFPPKEWKDNQNEVENCVKGYPAGEGMCSFEAEYTGKAKSAISFVLLDGDAGTAPGGYTCEPEICK